MIIRTNANQVMRGLTQRLTNPQVIDESIRQVATTMLSELGTRVFEKGEATDKGDIGSYSTKPMYVSITANPGRSFGRPIGKTGKSKFTTGKKAGEDHKSRYFERGYDQFKTTIGRNQLGKVNLSLSGQFARQMTVIPTSKGYGIGWTNSEMFKRAGYFTQKYNKKIWLLNEDETKLAKDLAKKYYFENLNNA